VNVLPTPILPSTPRLLGGTYFPPAVDPPAAGAETKNFTFNKKELQAKMLQNFRSSGLRFFIFWASLIRIRIYLYTSGSFNLLLLSSGLTKLDLNFFLSLKIHFNPQTMSANLATVSVTSWYYVMYR
jgi:hypothetical protein